MVIQFNNYKNSNKLIYMYYIYFQYKKYIVYTTFSSNFILKVL